MIVRLGSRAEGEKNGTMDHGSWGRRECLLFGSNQRFGPFLVVVWYVAWKIGEE